MSYLRRWNGSSWEYVDAKNADTANSAVNADKLENNTVIDILKKVYPIGSIYINANTATNPASLLGFGTWVRYGNGRVLVSQDGSQSEFNSLGETGGAKTHTLTVNQLPAHHFNYESFVSSGVTNHANQLHRDSNYRGSYNRRSRTTNTLGGNQPHNNLQPYIVVYMWRRTA